MTMIFDVKNNDEILMMSDMPNIITKIVDNKDIKLTIHDSIEDMNEKQIASFHAESLRELYKVKQDDVKQYLEACRDMGIDVTYLHITKTPDNIVIYPALAAFSKSSVVLTDCTMEYATELLQSLGLTELQLSEF
jgi:hypothetical protein